MYLSLSAYLTLQSGVSLFRSFSRSHLSLFRSLSLSYLPLSPSLPPSLQMVSEKVGGAEGTKLDEDFKDLERVRMCL